MDGMAAALRAHKTSGPIPDGKIGAIARRLFAGIDINMAPTTVAPGAQQQIGLAVVPSVAGPDVLSKRFPLTIFPCLFSRMERNAPARKSPPGLPGGRGFVIGRRARKPAAVATLRRYNLLRQSYLHLIEPARKPRRD